MKRVVFFIDGFNLYHSLDDHLELHKYKWLDLSELCKCFITSSEYINEIYYFTALPPWDPDKRKRHIVYITALRTKNIQIIFGNFRVKDKKCKICKKIYQTYEEKETDINIISYMFTLAIQDKYDMAILITGDSDLVHGLEILKSNFPHKAVGIIVPYGRRAKLLQKVATPRGIITTNHLNTSRFPERIDLGGGRLLTCPIPWH